MNSELIQWLGNVIVVLTAIGGLIKVIQIIFNLGQRLMVAPLLAQLATLSAQIDVLGKPDAVGGLHRVGGAEDGGNDRNHVHQRHAYHAQHVTPAVFEGVDDG